MKVYCAIVFIFAMFFSGKTQDTIPASKVQIIATQLTNKQVDSVVRNHKRDWYKKDRTWFYELKEHISGLNRDNIERGNDVRKLIIELDSAINDNNKITQEKLSLILSNQRLYAENSHLKKSVYLLTAAPHVAMSFAASFMGCLIAMGIYRAYLNWKKQKECGKQQRKG